MITNRLFFNKKMVKWLQYKVKYIYLADNKCNFTVKYYNV